MDKRAFLSRNSRKNNTFSYLKALMAAGVTFILLMVLVPLMTNHKAKAPSKKPNSDRGVVVKEIPRSEAVEDASSSQNALTDTTASAPQKPALGEQLQSSKAEAPLQTSIFEKPASLPTEMNGSSNPEATSGKKGPFPAVSSAPAASPVKDQTALTPPVSQDPSKVRSEAQPPSTAQAVVQKQKNQAKAATPPSGQALEQGGKESPAARKPEKQALAVATPAVKQKELSVPASTAKEQKPDSERPKSDKGKSTLQYVIQLGAYQSRENAEMQQESFRKKGYTVNIRSHYDYQKGQLYLVQLEPVGDIGKANSMMSRIKQEGMNPIMLKVGAAQ
jgi:cell division protein FtsN